MNKRLSLLSAVSLTCGIILITNTFYILRDKDLKTYSPQVMKRTLIKESNEVYTSYVIDDYMSRYRPKTYIQKEILQKEVDAYNKYNQDNRKINLDEYNLTIKKLLNNSRDYIGIPYVWGGETEKGMDCSAFVRDLYKSVGYKLPRVSKDQSKVGELIPRGKLKPGDLLYFDTRNYRDLSNITTPHKQNQYAEKMEKGFVPNTVSHVGMFIGDNKMIHASSGHGYITEDSLESNYYKSRFLFARRLIPNDY